MLNHLSIRLRLIILVAIPSITLVLAILLSLVVIRGLQGSAVNLFNDRLIPLQQLKTVSDAYAITIVDNLQKARSQMMPVAPAVANIEAAQANASQQIDAYLNTTLTPTEQRLINDIKPLLAAVNDEVARLTQQLQAGTLQQLAGDDFNRQLYATFDPLTGKIDELVAEQANAAEASIISTSEQVDGLIAFYIAAAIIVIIIVIVFSTLISRSIQRPLGRLTDSVSRISQQADLTIAIDVEGKDEVAKLATNLRDMFGKFRGLIETLQQASEQSSSATTQMNAINDEVASAVSDQRERLTSIASAMTEMSGAVREVASIASQTAERASSGDEEAQGGSASVRQGLATINELSQAVSESTEVIKQVDAHSNGISEVITVIRGIAEQTNLLALNAAIESARAGEAGRGFAVVADEVRNLAQNTQEATQKIGEMIEKLQASANSAVSNMSKASTLNESSVQATKQASEVLQTIASVLTEISDMNVQVSTATEEQSSVASEISEDINHFSQGLAVVSDNIDQSLQASENIAKLSNELYDQSLTFKVN